MNLRFAPAAVLLTFAAACGQPPSAEPAAHTGTAVRNARLGVATGEEVRVRPRNFSALAEPKAGSAPAFRWAPRGAPEDAAVASAARALALDRSPAAAAYAHLEAQAALDGRPADDLASLEEARIHDTGRGARVVRFRQRLGGVEVFRGGTAVVLDRQGGHVATSGTIASARDLPADPSFALGAAEVVARALTDVSGDAYAAGDLVPAGTAGAYERFSLHPETAAAHAAAFSRPARAKRVWFPLPGGLEPAWYVEVGLGQATARDSLEYGYVLSARDGRLLFRKDQASHAAFTYRVYASSSPPYTPYDGPQGFAGSPHPTGLPDGSTPEFVGQETVTLDFNPARTEHTGNAAWLAANATMTLGNNVDAYADIAGADGFSSGDVRGTTTGATQFIHAYDPASSPGVGSNRKAAVVQLFFLTNWLHDWYYDAGFDEAAGNAQASNFGLGGAENDRLLAEAQDLGGFDNANMRTPADGASPRMQMYVWVPSTEQYVRVNAPASAAGRTPAGVASGFGPTSFDLTGDVVAVVDAVAPAADGCSPLTNAAALAGKIALVDRGDCTFVTKIKFAQDAGAIGVIVRNVTEAQALQNMASDDTANAGLIDVPSGLIGLDAGGALGAALATGTVNVTLKRGTAPFRDGDLDTAIVAHEWGHYISNRLVGDATGLDTNHAGGLGEGWSDFHALLLMVRAEDADLPANAGYAGVYTIGAYAAGGDYALGGPNDSFYWAIRRLPYSTDFTKNPLTFRHIADGEEIPTLTGGGADIPVQFGASGLDNSEVHNAGEVWATMLWEAYAGLLREHAFADAQDRMKRYLVAAYKVTPSSPTLLEARDALLSVALAEDPADFTVLFDAFARRGAGIGAAGPDRYSPDNRGVVESFVAGPSLTAGAPTVTAVVDGACAKDADLVIDNGEIGTVRVTFENDGSTDLAATELTLSSDDPRVSFPGGTAVPLAATVPWVARGALQPTTSVEFQVGVEDAARGDVVAIALGFPAGYRQSDEPLVVHLRVNHDEVSTGRTTEDFEASSALAAWTTGAATPRWTRAALGAAQHVLHGPDSGQVSDVRVESPALTLGAGPATVTMRQRHAFEGTPGDAWYDGAVVEITTDGGAHWSDLGDAVKYGAAPAYRGILENSDGSTNPLAGRKALVGESPGYPEFSTLTLDLGTAYAGRTVRLRFRVGTDTYVGGAGWEIDEVRVTGATNAPFAGLTAEPGTCGLSGTVASAGAPQRVPEGETVTLDASGSAPGTAGASLTYAWTQTGGPTVALSDASGARPTFAAPAVDAETALTFAVAVSDGATQDTAETTVTVAALNLPPVVVITGPATARPGAAVTLDGSGSYDPEGVTALAYAWRVVGSDVPVLNGADTATVSFLAPAISRKTPYQIQLLVSDGVHAWSDTFTVTVVPSGSSGGGGCGTAGAAGPLALLALALLRRRRPRAGG